jgi:hypothetical protein
MWRVWEHAACLPLPRFPSRLRTWTSCAGGLGPASCRPCSRSGPGSCSWPPRGSPTPRSPSGSASLDQRSLPADAGTSAAGWAGCRTGPGTFKFSTDPQLAAKVHDVVGLYLHPPERAVVVGVDEKSQIQALERTQPVRGVWPGRPEQRTHDYTRHGTTTLFAALEVATGRVTNQCAARHRHQEFLAFLKQVARTSPLPPTPCHLRQLRHPQAPHGPCMAGQAPAGPAALHPDLGVVAEPGGGVLLPHRAPGASPRRLRQRHRSHRRDRSLLCRLERALSAVLLDQARRHNPHQAQPSNHLSDAAPGVALGEPDRWRSG